MKVAAAVLFFVGFLVLFFIMAACEQDVIGNVSTAVFGVLTLVGIAICGAIVGIDDIKKEIERRKK